MFTDYAPPYAASATWKNYFRLITTSEQLSRKCRTLKYADIKYLGDDDYTQMVRTMAANLQYMGLQYVVRAINIYAKQLDLDQDYDFIVSKLLEYMSKKTTVVERNELRKLFHADIKDFKLPQSSHFELNESSDQRLEFFYTTELFVALSSWNNDVNAFRLLVPLLKSPQIMTLVIDHLADGGLTTYFGKVSCLGTSCVVKDNKYFRSNIHRTVDRWDLRKELETIYCKNFYDLEYKKSAFDDDGNKLIDLQNSDDDYFKVNQLISLISGMPDLAIRAKNEEEFKKLLQTSLDREWDYSTGVYLEKLKPKLLYEEYVTAELVPSSFYLKDKYKIIFDINMGEFDRINQYIGKIRASITIKMANSVLRWVYRARKDEYTVHRLAREIEYHLRSKEKFFKDAPWNKNITPLMAKELLSQIEEIPLSSSDRSDIEIEFRYAPFALNYIQKYSPNTL